MKNNQICCQVKMEGVGLTEVLQGEARYIAILSAQLLKL